MLRFFLAIVTFVIPTYGISSGAQGDVVWTLKTQDKCKVFIHEVGMGEPTLVFHGGPGGEYSNLFLGLKFLENKLRLVHFDQRGSLRSPCDENAVLGIEQIATDVEQLIKVREFKKVNIIANSYGAIVAANFLKKNPGIVDKVLIIAPVPLAGNADDIESISEKREEEMWNRPVVDSILKEQKLTRKKPSNDFDFSRWIQIRIGAANLTNADRWPLLRMVPIDMSYSSQLEIRKSVGRSWSFLDEAKAKGENFGVIIGTDDILPFSFHKVWLDKLPKAQIEIIQNAGHGIWIDQPEFFAKSVSKFLFENSKFESKEN